MDVQSVLTRPRASRAGDSKPHTPLRPHPGRLRPPAREKPERGCEQAPAALAARGPARRAVLRRAHRAPRQGAAAPAGRHSPPRRPRAHCRPRAERGPDGGVHRLPPCPGGAGGAKALVHTQGRPRVFKLAQPRARGNEARRHRRRHDAGGDRRRAYCDHFHTEKTPGAPARIKYKAREGISPPGPCGFCSPYQRSSALARMFRQRNTANSVTSAFTAASTSSAAHSVRTMETRMAAAMPGAAMSSSTTK